MNKSTYAITIALLLSGTTYASNNFYINLGAGAVFPSQNSSYTSDSSTVLYNPTSIGTSIFILPNVNWKNTYNAGYMTDIALGYQFTPHWRSDIEFAYQNINRKTSGSYGWKEMYSTTGATYATSNGNPFSTVSTRAQVYTLMTNLYYDFKNNSKITPIVGAGFGTAWLHSNSTIGSNTLNVDDPSTPLFETAPASQTSASLYGTAFAWQVKAGLAYEINNKTSVALLYRLLGTTQFKASSSNIVTNPDASGSSLFYIAQHNIQGLLNNSIELNVKFDI